MHTARRKILSVLLAISLLMSYLPVGATSAFATEKTSITYLDEDGEEKNCNNAIELTKNMTELKSGWYVVHNVVNIGNRVTVNGDVHLILTDGCTINVTQGIAVNGSNSLTIYAQSTGKNQGVLAMNPYGRPPEGSAGIGSSINQKGGIITINGGQINVHPNDNTAALGGTDSIVNINGGFINAVCFKQDNGVGAIGGENSIININGGYVSTYYNGNEITKSIGIGGPNSSVIINGGYVSTASKIDAHLTTGTNGSAVINAASICDYSSQEEWQCVVLEGGFGFNCKGKVYGDVTIDSDMFLPYYTTLDVPAGTSLTIPEDVTVTSNYSANIQNNGAVYNYGVISEDLDAILTNNSNLYNYGTISISDVINNGTIYNYGTVSKADVINNGSIYSNTAIDGVDDIKPIISVAFNEVTMKKENMETNSFTYGDIVAISGTISKQLNNNINELDKEQVALYSGETKLATAAVENSGSFVLTYDTAKQGLKATGKTQILTLKYSGSDALNQAEYDIADFTLNKKPVTAKVMDNGITKTYDGKTDASVTLGFEDGALLTGDKVSVAAPDAVYTSVDVGDAIAIDLGTLTIEGDDVDWYTVNAPTDVTGAITKATQEAPDRNEGYAIDFAEEVIRVKDDVKSVYELSATNEEDATCEQWLKLAPGEAESTVYIRKVETSNLFASDWTYVTIPARLEAPKVTGVNETLKGSNDGKIIGFNADLAYQISRDAGQTWEDVSLTGTELIGLSAGSYQVRQKATDSTFAGAAATVEIKSGEVPTYTLNVTAPSFENATVGYTQPDAKPIVIKSTGNTAATVSGVSLSGDTNAFVLNKTDGTTIQAGVTDSNTYTIRPAANLPADIYSATITVTYDCDATATAEVAFIVEAQNPTPIPDPDPNPSDPAPGPSGEDQDNNTTTITNPDGSITTITEEENGTVTETTKYPDGSVVTEEKGPAGIVTTTTEDANGSSSVVTKEDGKTIAAVTLSEDSIAEKEKDGFVLLPMPSLDATQDDSTGDQVTVRLPGDEEVLIKVPVTNPTPGTVAVIIGEDGTETVVKDSVSTEDGIVFKLRDGDTIVLQDRAMTFSDVSSTHWANGDIDFVSSRGLFTGVSEDVFAAEDPMTRAMFVSVLARYAGDDNQAVEGEPWYAGAREWAIENGVSDGTMMNQSITREQLVTMLYRFAGPFETNADLSPFSDVDSISSFATEAMKWAVEEGIIGGMTSTKLAPQETATRAQVAAIFHRFVTWELMG